MKTRNFVAKNSPTAGSGYHKDKKRAEKDGDNKHKENYMDQVQKEKKIPHDNMPEETFEKMLKLSSAYFDIRFKDNALENITKTHHVRLGNILIWTSRLFIPDCWLILDDDDNVIDGFWFSGDYKFNDVFVKDIERVTRYARF